MGTVPPVEPDPSSADRDIKPRSAPVTGDTAPGRRRALLFGCNGSATIPNPLRYAENDARDMAAALEAVGWELAHAPLLGDAVTNASVKEQVQTLARTATEHDTLMVYFAGHGERLTVDERDDVYLVTSTFDLDEVAFDADAAPSLRWLRTMLFGPRCRAERVLLIVDCCYAGNFDQTTPTHQELFAVFRALLGDPARDATPRNAVRVMLTAASHDAAAHERDGHGVFTAALLDALNGRAVESLDAHGDLTLGRLVDYLKARLPTQHPNLYGELPGPSVVLCRHEKESHAARQQQADAARTAPRRAELTAAITRSSEWYKK